MDEVFRALADPTRRELLDRLRADNGQTLGELCGQLAMSRQAVSKHLAILEEANLVATVAAGPGEAALPEPGADRGNLRPVDRQIRKGAHRGPRRPEARA